MTAPNTIAIVTDAWFPQVNGVVRTLSRTKQELESRGHRVEVISPHGYQSVPCPTYPEIRLALFAARSVKKRLTTLKPDAVHIATEGPLGLAARRWCRTESTAIYDQLPHTIPRIHPIAFTDPNQLVLCIFKMVSWTRTPHVGCHALHGKRIG